MTKAELEKLNAQLVEALRLAREAINELSLVVTAALEALGDSTD